MSRIWTIARKEWKGLFDHATAYILLVVFLVLNFFFYFRAAFVVREASLRPMFDLLPWLLLFFVPAVAMRTLAEERRSGTLELVLAQPLREWELIVGKFLGSLFFVGVALAATIPAGLSLHLAGDPDGGMIVGQYAGAVLVAAQFTAIGVWASSLTRNQITAFVAAVAVGFVFLAVGLDLVLFAVPAWAGEFVGRLAVLPHFQSVARGVIDFRDVLYFVSAAGAFLFLAYWALVRERANRRSAAYRNLRWAALLVPAIAIALNLAGGYAGFRWDLTDSRLYTLSPASRQILRNLDDVVTLKLFASSDLPPQVALTKRDVRDLLNDYRRASRGNVRVAIRAPDKEEAAREEAASLGIPPVQFNVLREDQFQVTQGYLGIAVQYADASEIVPFVRNLADLEYRLTSYIHALTARDTPQVGFLAGHGEKSGFREYGTWRREMQGRYVVTDVRLPDDSAALRELDVLVVAGPTQEIPDSVRAQVRAFLEGGGSGLFLIDRVTVNPQFLQAMPNPFSFADFVERYGARVAPGLVYDLRSNETVTFGGGFVSVIVPYPFWVRALPLESPMTRDLQSVVLPWASAVEPTDTARFDFRPIWSTSAFASREAGPLNLDPQRDFRRASVDDLADHVLAASVRPKGDRGAGGEAAGPAPAWRIVVVGDSDFLTDQFARSAPENVAFAVNAVDWLAEEEALIGIRSRAVGPRALVFSSDFERNAIKWGNLVGVPLVVVALGAWHLWRRRSLQRLAYRPAGAAAAEAAGAGAGG